MITKLLFQKSIALLVFTLFLGVLFSSVSVYAADKSIVLKKYPNLKFGFTSQNLAKWLPNSVANLKAVIDFAKQKGFSFIELRDANDLSERSGLVDWHGYRTRRQFHTSA